MHTNERVKTYPVLDCTDRHAPAWLRAEWILTAPQRMVETLFVWHDRWVERRELLEMDERMLRDCGLSRRDIERVTRKPFWRA